jgi:sigma-B regulation protein RsbU (phosphoserine phosphatase)
MTDSLGSLLVVDDDELNRDLLARRLRTEGYDVVLGRDGKHALELIHSGTFALILLDVMMPGLDGLAVLAILRATHSTTDLPIIMVTAKDKSEDVVAALERGANDYVTKPLDFPVVLARVHTQLSLKRSVEQIRELKGNLAARNRELEATNRKMSLELKSAAKVQASLLPHRTPTVAGLSFAWAFRPCELLAGDGLNVVQLDETHVGLYVLDVSGHGVAAALLSVSISRVLSPPSDPASILVNRGARPVTPAEVADQLNRIFPFDVAEQYFTLVYGVLDIITGEFRYVSAGHPGPIHVHSEGGPELLDGRGFPIGLAEDPYEERSIRLRAGDRLYLYSDGVPEATTPTGEQFSSERLLMIADRDHDESLPAAIVALREDVERWCAPAGVPDDVTILGVEMSRLASVRERG